MKELKGSFCTVINCMDGRVQLPVNSYMTKNYKVDFVDTITEAGPNRILCQPKKNLSKSIINRVNISLNKHKSKIIAIVGHNDCAGSPCSDDKQITYTLKAVAFLKRKYPAIKIIGLFVDVFSWKVKEVR